MAKKSFSFDRIVNKPEPKPAPQKKVSTPEPKKEVEIKAKEVKQTPASPAPKKAVEKPVVKTKAAKPGKKKYDIREGQKKIDKDLVNSVGRKKFTTMIRPDLRNLLDNIAHNNNISVAQLLEDILDEYFGNG